MLDDDSLRGGGEKWKPRLQSDVKMPERVSVEQVVTRVSKGVQPPLIAIDGLPCSGKGTLVDSLRERVNLDCIELDDFVLPEEHWPSRDQPASLFSSSDTMLSWTRLKP
jgi:hypothetical protein